MRKPADRVKKEQHEWYSLASTISGLTMRLGIVKAVKLSDNGYTLVQVYAANQSKQPRENWDPEFFGDIWIPVAMHHQQGPTFRITPGMRVMVLYDILSIKRCVALPLPKGDRGENYKLPGGSGFLEAAVLTGI